MTSETTQFSQWDAEIRAFEEAERKSPPPQNAIVFAGSSSMKFWFSLARDFAGVPVVNRGFGGSQIEDSTYFAPRILLPLHPRQVVFYAGDNDLFNGKSPHRVLEDYGAFVRAVRAGEATPAVSFISIKPSPGRAELLPAIREANRLIEEWCDDDESLDFIDIFHPMLNSEGRPRKELWTSDGVHLSRAGYKLWAEIIRPYLRDA